MITVGLFENLSIFPFWPSIQTKPVASHWCIFLASASLRNWTHFIITVIDFTRCETNSALPSALCFSLYMSCSCFVFPSFCLFSHTPAALSVFYPLPYVLVFPYMQYLATHIMVYPLLIDMPNSVYEIQVLALTFCSPPGFSLKFNVTLASFTLTKHESPHQLKCLEAIKQFYGHTYRDEM